MVTRVQKQTIAIDLSRQYTLSHCLQVKIEKDIFGKDYVHCLQHIFVTLQVQSHNLNSYPTSQNM